MANMMENHGWMRCPRAGRTKRPGWKCPRALNRGSVGFVIAWTLTPVVCRFLESRGRLLSTLWAKTAAHFEQMIDACQHKTQHIHHMKYPTKHHKTHALCCLSLFQKWGLFIGRDNPQSTSERFSWRRSSGHATY